MRKEKELDSKVVCTDRQKEIFLSSKYFHFQIKKPAEAEKFKLEKLAEAERLRIVLEAEANAEALAVKGEAEAFAIGLSTTRDQSDWSTRGPRFT